MTDATDLVQPDTTPTEASKKDVVKIANISGRMLTLNLDDAIRDHSDFGHQRLVRIRSTHNKKTGIVSYSKERISIPQSLMLPAGSEMEVPVQVLACQAVKKAIKTKKLAKKA